jgi:hypothetical protein
MIDVSRGPADSGNFSSPTSSQRKLTSSEVIGSMNVNRRLIRSNLPRDLSGLITIMGFLIMTPLP